MCGRFTLTTDRDQIEERFSFRMTNVTLTPHYNIAPSQPVLSLMSDGKENRAGFLRWGLIPSWAKDEAIGNRMINARAETAAEKPSFRGAMRHRRCLVPADGFYEWIGQPGAKRPHLLRPVKSGPMAFAGLWEHWLGPDGSEIETMAILTVPANAVAARVHDRMPVILAPENFEAWLDISSGRSNPAETLLRPAADDLLEILEVSPKLNNSRNEGPEAQVIIGKMLI